MKNRKPMLSIPITPRTLATKVSGRLRLKILTANVHKPRMRAHNNSEPSCPPQTAEIRYCKGRKLFEFWATYITEKSLLMNEYIRHKNAIAMKKNCPRAAGRANAIHSGLPRAAPAMGGKEGRERNGRGGRRGEGEKWA